jgi:hypothetical protein
MTGDNHKVRPERKLDVRHFDEEGQSMMEGSAEPALCVVFSPGEGKQVRHALLAVERFVAINCELFELVEEIREVG